MAETNAVYPASLDVDYPDRDLNRLTSFFRIFTIIPIVIVLGLLAGGGSGWEDEAGKNWSYGAGGAGAVIAPLVLMILFRKKYPRWWFDWNLALTRFSYRVCAYFSLLRDEYPSTDEEQAVHVEITYPDAQAELNRWLPLVKWILAFPHYVVLAFLWLAAIICIIFSWFAILFTGRYPKGLFNFVVGVTRWGLRVEAYALLLVTDRYPPFSL
ncbi:DUF4389 domain-containing protein, partial [Chloroflexota bacterium]